MIRAVEDIIMLLISNSEHQEEVSWDSKITTDELERVRSFKEHFKQEMYVDASLPNALGMTREMIWGFESPAPADLLHAVRVRRQH